MSAPAPVTPPLLVATGIHKSFRSGERPIEVLRGVDLTMRAGEVLSIRGESGSGKSTLLNVLAAIEIADAGDVQWNGESLKGIAAARLPALRAAYLGFVFQAFYLIPELNVLENVCLPARITGAPLAKARQRARLLLAELGLTGRSDSYPAQLSGGERQRAAIARALINEPMLVLADEPTGNLDERTSERVIEAFFRVVRESGTALVLVTHNPGFAAMAARRLRMENGLLHASSNEGSAQCESRLR